MAIYTPAHSGTLQTNYHCPRYPVNASEQIRRSPKGSSKSGVTPMREESGKNDSALYIGQQVGTVVEKNTRLERKIVRNKL